MQGQILFFLGLGRVGVMSRWGVLFWHKCMGVLDGFMSDKEESSLEIAELILIKAEILLKNSKKMAYGEH